jgi:alpha-amylase
MYTFFSRLNQARQAAGNASSSFYTSQVSTLQPASADHQMNLTVLSPTDLLIAKGPLVSVLTNRGSNSPNITIPVASSGTGFAPRSTILEVLTCNTYLTDDNGNVDVPIINGSPRVMIAASQRGTLCASVVTNGTTTAPQGSASGVERVRPGGLLGILACVVGLGVLSGI